MGADGAPRLHELARRHRLGPRQRAQLAGVLDVLARDPQAPTSVCAPEQAVDVHIADSLAALDVEAVRRSRQIADLGAGAGFPGVALAVALPSARVSLVESQRRKCEFLGRLCATAGVKNACVVCARAEEWHEGLGANDVAVARALAPQAVVLEYAAPLLRAGGRLVDWRGRRRPQEERAARVAARELGLEPVEVVASAPFRGVTDRNLHLYVKVKATPQRFPRRPGIARKRPLGSSVQA
jgi:16S rRNA (guanine527-N7)-methyltransferase